MLMYQADLVPIYKSHGALKYKGVTSLLLNGDVILQASNSF